MADRQVVLSTVPYPKSQAPTKVGILTNQEGSECAIVGWPPKARTPDRTRMDSDGADVRTACSSTQSVVPLRPRQHALPGRF